MERFASIDVGTNSIKLTLVERDKTGDFVPLVDTSRTTRLGEGFHAGRLRETAIRRTLDGLADYVEICRQHRVGATAVVGTAALRDAVNRDEFIQRAHELGLDTEVIPGEEEARLSYLAVRRDPRWRDVENLLVIDIGGGSTEVIFGDRLGRNIDQRISLPLGAVRLTEAALHSDPPTVQQMAEANRMAEETLQKLYLRPLSYAAVGVGGTFVNLAAILLHLAEHDSERLHGTELSLTDVEGQVALFAAHTIEERKQIVGLDPSRADIILGGALTLCQVMCKARLERIAVSCRGLRWGVLYDRFG